MYGDGYGMKILLLINWKIKYCDTIPENLQPSDYSCPEEPFWFFKYFSEVPEVDVVDISSPKWVEKIENKIRFHFYQTLKVLSKIKQYDLIFIHGSNSAMLLGAIKRILRISMPPILDVDISSFHQASTSGIIHRLSQFSSKAFDYMVYHTSSQIDYYKKEFPWLVNKCEFVPLGVDYNYWKTKQYPVIPERKNYIVCVGYRKRDWNTLLKAYNELNIDEELYLIGKPDIKCENSKIKVLPFIPISELMTYIVNAKFSVIPLDDFNYSFAQLTLLQQMALGVPILAADVYAIRDYIKCSSGVISYIPYDVENLKIKLQELSKLKEADLRKMGQNNMECIMTVLSEQQMAQRFERICRMLYGGKEG